MRLRSRYGLSGRHRDDDFDQPFGGNLHEASSWNCQGATELASAFGQQGNFDQPRDPECRCLLESVTKLARA